MTTNFEQSFQSGMKDIKQEVARNLYYKLDKLLQRLVDDEDEEGAKISLKAKNYIANELHKYIIDQYGEY